MAPVTPPRLRLRLHFGDMLMLGPGKADLLAQIGATGSISAAGRALGMSYKRAWSLVEEMNAGFRAPLVLSMRGGPGGGGAQLTATGEEVLRRFRALEALVLRDPGGDLAAIAALLAEPELTGDDRSQPATVDPDRAI